MLYRVRVKTTGFSKQDTEYFLKFEGQAVRTVPARHASTEFHLQEAVDTLEKLKQRGIAAEVCESIWGETIGQAFERTPVERMIPAEWQWLVPLLRKTADGRAFLQANQQTVFGKDAAEVVEKIIALADSFDQWRDWLAASEPAPQPPAPPPPPPEPTWGYWITGGASFRSGRFSDREQALNVAYRLQQRGQHVIVVNERGIEQR